MWPFKRSVSDFEKLYSKFLVDSYSYLEFRGMGISHQVPLRLRLMDLYVPLRAVQTDNRASGQPEFHDSDRIHGLSPFAGTKLISLVDEASITVILGDPGSGKTTFLKLMTLLLAKAGARRGSRAYVPYLVPLSAYAQALSSHDEALADFLTTHLRSRGFVAPSIENEVKTHLRDGRACLLLDGLDEINDMPMRNNVRQRIEDFSTLYSDVGNKAVITSRINGYEDVRLGVSGIQQCIITEFSDDDIFEFADKWTRAVERAASDSVETSRKKSDEERIELIQAIRVNDGVKELARSPLLLTVIALMKRADVELPQRRVELYNRCIDSLLKHWNYARSLGQGGYAVVDLLETVRILASVALWMQEQNQGLVLVSKQHLHNKLEELFTNKGYESSKALAATFITEMRHVNSVLLERGHDQFCFAHLSFQEYLAAVGLVLGVGDAPADLARALGEKLRWDNWWEVGLLAIGYVGVIQQRDEAAGLVLQDLVRASGATATEHRKLVTFAGQAIADCWPAGVSADGRSAISRALHALAQPTKGSAHSAERLRAADLLGWISPPPAELTDVTHLEFAFVPSGDFLIAADSKRTLHKLDYPYWIGRFPVSQSQYGEFRKRGFDTDAYWTSNGLRWRDDPAVDHRLFLARSFRTPTRPVCAVTVYEAEAFAAWASAVLRASGAIKPGQRCALPSEVEWVKAARGGVEVPAAGSTWSAASGVPCEVLGDVLLFQNEWPDRVFPAGLTLTPASANYFASEWNETSALGCYAQAASPYGAEEMCGNVWEWLRTNWGPDWDESLFRLPYLPGDGREQVEPPEAWLRMVKGGSYSKAEQLLHLSIDYRTRNSPDGRYLNHGFRLVIIDNAHDTCMAVPSLT